MKPFKHTITVNNKKYSYIIKPIDKKVIFFECSAAGISQKFLIEDVSALLVDLPALILSEIEWNKKQEEVIRFRVSSEDKRKIEKNAISAGFPTISSFLRTLGLNTNTYNVPA